MRKPLLLLVDDDTAVLEALEATLAPRFSEIACLEAYTSGPAVLDRVPVWEAEGRRVAVVVADQKMPGMTGVDLLTRLHGSACAAAAQAVLLTGYAGLESALAAVNDAGVRRYLAKPWDGHQLQEAVADLFGLWLRDTPHGGYYVFQGVSTRRELEEIFRLRHEVYGGDQNTAWMTDGQYAGYEWDEYEGHSRHYALWAMGPGKTLTGYFRAVTMNETAILPVLLELADEHRELHAKLTAPHPLIPILKYFGQADAVREFLARSQAEARTVMEGTRAIVREVHTGSEEKTRSTSLGVFVVETALAILTETPGSRREGGFDWGLDSVRLSHMPFYKSCGFQLLPGTEPEHSPLFGCDIVCLVIQREWISPRRRDRVASLAGRLARQDHVCRCVTWPACLGTPYMIGDFSDVDVFCPLSARRVSGSEGGGESGSSTTNSVLPGRD